MTPEMELMNQFIGKVDYYKLTLLKPMREACDGWTSDDIRSGIKWLVATDLAIQTGISINKVLEFLNNVNLEELIK